MERLASPAHAAYVYAQNQVSAISEQLTTLPEMAPLADIVTGATVRPGAPTVFQPAWVRDTQTLPLMPE